MITSVFHNDPSPLRPLSEFEVGDWFIPIEFPECRYQMINPGGHSPKCSIRCLEYGPDAYHVQQYLDRTSLGIPIPAPKSIETTTTLSW